LRRCPAGRRLVRRGGARAAARSLFLVSRIWALMRRRSSGELGGVLVTGQGSRRLAAFVS
jgi:ferric-dicitrate binding protein FerR (iron transport regulator)